MKLYIFDVEHGGCALLQADTGALMLIDCGHNSHTGWRPSSALPSWNIQAIDLLVVTNYDEDHVSDLVNLRKRVNIGAVLTNKSVSPDLIKDLKSETGMGNGISELCNMLSTYH